MKLHRFTGSVLFIALFISAVAAKADDLTGASLTGVITGESNTKVTTQFTSPAVVGPTVEFTGDIHENFFDEDYKISADFGSDDLTVVFSSADPDSNIQSQDDLLSLSFSAFPLSFSGFNTVSYSCDSSLGTHCSDAASGLSSATYSGSTLALSFDTIDSGNTYVFSSRSTAPAPEPSTFVFLGTGALSLGGVLRRRLATVS